MAKGEVDTISYRFFLYRYFFRVIYGIAPSDIRSAPPRNLFCGSCYFDKWHSSRKNLFLELLYTNNPNRDCAIYPGSNIWFSSSLLQHCRR
nr:MAG TPA: hypothetical protein [Caudoviricetes sp.]